VIVPAWNEASVLGRTLDQLMRLEYPPELLRAYVVDDGSDDGTPELIDAKAAHYSRRVVNLRRENGGQGKAHTINHGLRQIQAEDWYEAVLVIDADVISPPGSLRRMTHHFGDPEIGAVTAYIKEGSRPSNYMNRFIAFEYITAQAGARRAQNVLGVQACLAGGAQLITRESLDAVGGVVDTTTPAEDTVTTFRIQLAGKRVVFEPQAIVWAEEPREVVGLWKQRIRWARGNVQVTLLFRRVWLNRRSGRRLGRDARARLRVHHGLELLGRPRDGALDVARGPRLPRGGEPADHAALEEQRREQPPSAGCSSANWSSCS
jgi:cellulose synthase/poly-beta-1,6-N-acetylglucosamine synthase-like glycosyltransferase